MSQDLDPGLQLKLAAEIAISVINRSEVPPEQVQDLIVRIRRALAQDLAESQSLMGQADGSGPFTRTDQEGQSSERTASLRAVASPTPAVPISDSITDEYLISLEDGKPYRSLRRHLMAKYQMTPEDYRRKWNLPPDYPMVAPSYARDRSEVAKRIGLGRATPKSARAPSARR